MTTMSLSSSVIAAGYRIRDEQFLDGGARVGWIVANDGVITDMQYYDPGFC